MPANRYFRDQIKQDDLILGTVVSTADPLIVEAVAGSRFDYLMFDSEHGYLDRQTLALSVMAANAANQRCLVRVGGDEPVQYYQPLDCGADGVIVPRVKTAADVRRAVDSCRYPPQGSRGYGPTRAGRYGRQEAAYVAQANAAIAVIVQVETKEAVQNLDEILTVEGFDGILIGRNDLAGSLGLPRDHNDPEMLKVCAAVLAGARAAGLGRGIACRVDKETIVGLQEMGANMFLVGGHIDFMLSSIDQFLGGFDRT